MSATSRPTQILSGGLPWPSIRGARLLHRLTWSPSPQNQDDDDPVADFPYDLELCVPTAGHVALVLVKRPQASPVTRTSTQPPTPTANMSAAPAAPRVVYVLDALPPGHSPGEKPGSNKKTGVQLPQQSVDELELVQELFAASTRAAGGKEGSVLIKAPLLCARFDCKVVSIRFIRSTGAIQKRRGLRDSGAKVPKLVGNAAPLRCVVAREDGMAYLWEWQADLLQWVFLNRLCFLENPNLKWTRPVAAFTTTDLPHDSGMHSQEDSGVNGNGLSSSGATEFAWWSTATKHDPKLKLRRLRFERATDALRATDVVTGNAFMPKLSCDDVVKLFSSKLGLFVISAKHGIFFRSAMAPLRMVSLDWKDVLPLDVGAVALDLKSILMCLHSVTGELVILQRKSGKVYLVTPRPLRTTNSGGISNVEPSFNSSCSELFSRELTALSARKGPSTSTKDAKDPTFKPIDVAAYRHFLLVLCQRVLHVYTLITGELLDTVTLPSTTENPQQRGYPKYKFWNISGSASSVGLWGSQGFWTIRLPPAKALGTSLQHSSTSKEKINEPETRNPEAAFLAVKDYGAGDLHLDAVRYALEVLKRVAPSAMDPSQRYPEVWEAVWNTVSSPALLLALLDNRATSEHVVHELAQHVTALYNAASNIRSNGRLNGSAKANFKADQLLRLTPANLESLHHLSNWIVLAKRKLARLEASSDVSLKKCATDDHGNRLHRAVSQLKNVLANEDDLSLPPSLSNDLPRKDSIVDPEDARNFRLSRKLRPMSSLRFAAGCSTNSDRQGQQWLLQLEAFLLDGVAFKKGTEHRNIRADATPSHRLFHSERVLADFRNVAASSFSKHMYLESISRLYLLYEPASLLPFIRCVERFCPRIFSLTGHQTLARSNAERAMTLFPPLQYFTNKILRERGGAKGQAAQASLLAYVDLLSYCGHHSEACRALLQCDLYEEAKQKLLLLQKDPRQEQNAGENEQEEESSARNTAAGAVYFLLLEYCVSHCDAAELKTLLTLKPAHVDMLHVLRALRADFAKQEGKQSGVTVGDLRGALQTLMQLRRSAVAH